MNTNQISKLILTILASLYFLWCATDPSQWHFIDNVNLLIHEGGHVIFIPFGKFMTVLGGSLTQIVLPTLFVIYFYKHNQSYSASLTLFWTGENLLNVSYYAADAKKMQLPLLFGDSSIHDWNWLLSSTHLLAHTNTIASIIQLLGIISICSAIAFSLYFSLRQETPQ